MSMGDISTLIRNSGLRVFEGYAATGSKPPYIVTRPMIADAGDLALCGHPMDWDNRFGVYCVAESVAASYNLAVLVIKALQGKRVGDDVISCSMGYSGAQVESRYETQVTVQLYQGEL